LILDIDLGQKSDLFFVLLNFFKLIYYNDLMDVGNLT